MDDYSVKVVIYITQAHCCLCLLKMLFILLSIYETIHKVFHVEGGWASDPLLYLPSINVEPFYRDNQNSWGLANRKLLCRDLQ